MKTEITEQEQSITVADILELESMFNFNMPENLKKLYLKHNGGIIDDGYYEIHSIKYGESLLEETIDSLQFIEQHIPKEYLPFATTAVGHLICIYTDSGSKNGHIYLFRHDELEPVFYDISLEKFLKVDSIDDL
ncbi:SMI1/KNR4 family protein [Chryseobacterium caseinilyticum]|uniref:SMI1/KNR4 family protein n=1 Tax=Chryseobacterium caseinilyticum TaxID=2771428 RepID=A0ABR8ZAT0_9FLAO|nr:SMI1/KNR4 family protein [Chryseobacterium caseinilyticum]MBD8082415.1 SMI1/KNR4 family protein [Chryseobacterium caseinilyticum]